MPISVNEIGSPVVTSRQMTTALFLGADGDWYFVAQAYVLIPEWFVVNLRTGAYTTRLGTIGIYANTNFQIASANTPINTTNQLMAANGRIAFLERGLNLAYLNPATYAVVDMPELTPPTTTGTETPLGVAVAHEALFNAFYSPDGTKLFAMSQAPSGVKPCVALWDSVALTFSVVGKVGTNTDGFTRYAYYGGYNPTTNKMVVSDGEHRWSIGELDIATGVYTPIEIDIGRLLTIDSAIIDDQRDRITVFGLPNGIKAEIIDDGVLYSYWVDTSAASVVSGAYRGALHAYPGSGAPPSGAVNCSPFVASLPDPPEIDWSRGIGRVLWR